MKVTNSAFLSKSFEIRLLERTDSPEHPPAGYIEANHIDGNDVRHRLELWLINPREDYQAVFIACTQVIQRPDEVTEIGKFLKEVDLGTPLQGKHLPDLWVPADITQPLELDGGDMITVNRRKKTTDFVLVKNKKTGDSFVEIWHNDKRTHLFLVNPPWIPLCVFDVLSVNYEFMTFDKLVSWLSEEIKLIERGDPRFFEPVI